MTDELPSLTIDRSGRWCRLASGNEIAIRGPNGWEKYSLGSDGIEMFQRYADEFESASYDYLAAEDEASELEALKLRAQASVKPKPIRRKAKP